MAAGSMDSKESLLAVGLGFLRGRSLTGSLFGRKYQEAPTLEKGIDKKAEQPRKD